MIAIDCKGYAEEVLKSAAERMALVKNPKGLLILHAGEDPASATYMKGKKNDCEKTGIPCWDMAADSEEHLLWMIREANKDSRVGGMIVQLPLPSGWDEDRAINEVALGKDVDGFRTGSPFAPCTPEGVVFLLERELYDLAGKNILLIGKGKLVGKPLIPLLLEKGVTLTICGSKTKSLTNWTLSRTWDAIIMATGKEGLLNEWQMDCKVLIDVGVHRGADGKLHGDTTIRDGGSYFRVAMTPNGPGRMTRAMLIEHMVEVQE